MKKAGRERKEFKALLVSEKRILFDWLLFNCNVLLFKKKVLKDLLVATDYLDAKVIMVCEDLLENRASTDGRAKSDAREYPSKESRATTVNFIQKL